jgi:DNA mismatch repair protein MutS2
VKPFMVDKTLEYLDYTRLLPLIERYCSTAFTGERILSLRPLENIAQIQQQQEKIQAVLEIIQLHGHIPLDDIPDVRNVLSRLALDELSLNSADFLIIGGFLSATRDILAFLKKIPNKPAYLDSISNTLSTLSHITSLIKKTINEEGVIEDSASYELSKIRSDLYQQKERAKRTLDQMMEKDTVRPVLQDHYIAIRNGRYVIPLKPNFNQFFQGIVHDYSHSLKTSFVEPIQIMEMNNTISVLANEEKEEELRVLQDLTRSVRHHKAELDHNLSSIADLDFYHALARFAEKFNCVCPRVEEDGAIEIRGAVNPFIAVTKQENAIPIDIIVGEDKKAVIISGPNGDGKTVALKTTGLLLTMASAGLFIPAKGIPRLRLFPGIFAVLGDQQDISMELSTFTAHIEAIRNVYEVSRGGELVLIDEIGGGTEPQEASALSMGIIDAFVDKDCTVFVTTHLNLLKAYGATQSFALNIATDYDSATMKPLYRLLYGIAGVSNALKVAEKNGMPAAIIEKSYGYLGKQEYLLNDLVQGLEKEKKGVEEERTKVSIYRKEMTKRLQAIKEKRDEYLAKVEDDCKKKVHVLQLELDEIRKTIAKQDRESIKAAKQRVSVIQRRFISEKASIISTALSLGDYVHVRTIGKDGYIVKIDDDKHIVEVVVGNMRMRINKDYVERTSKGKKDKIEQTLIAVTDIEVPEINVRGMRVDEALDEVDRFIDRAVVHGNIELKIVHGIGTGKLMTAIRAHLTDLRYVKDIKKDDRNSGVTIVELI